MSKMKEVYTACILHGVDPETVNDEDLAVIADLWAFFNDIEHAVEAYKQGYTASELYSKGSYPPYWIYLLWVKA